MRHPGLYIDKARSKGRGVFCEVALQEDEVIEVAPVIVMSDDDRKVLDQTLLHDYIFEWTPEGKNMCCMALGYVPVYNHSYQSNCEYFMNYEEQTIFIKTMRTIPKGEELTINYNGDWNDASPVWFDAI
ncbi:MAG TPA: SET domain-containing protein-lysine N-methyltransferase [Flavipsychrobacter sp.]|nr:SET domain-containing protein-lysine N-methyltransferase [Flavipsychrobacter sp.]